MTTNHHTQIPTNAAGLSSNINAPLGQLDSALSGILAGSKLFTQMAFAAATTKTIASGVITSDKSLHLVAAETGTADNLDTITAVNNSILFLKADSGDTITITPFGNITNTPVVLSGNKIVALFCQNSQWCVIGGDSSYPKGYIAGLEVNITSDTTYGVQEGVCLDDTNTVVMELTAHAGAITSSGINGLDTGVEASDTWYYVWVIKGSSGTETILSTSLSTPTLPAGYDSYKRRIGVIRNDASSNLLRQYMLRGGYLDRHVMYLEDCTATPFMVANAVNLSAAPTFTSVDCTAVQPPTSTSIYLSAQVTNFTSGGDILWRTTSGQGQHFFMRGNATLQIGKGIGLYPTTATQTIDFAGTAEDENFSLYVDGYVDNLTPDLV